MRTVQVRSVGAHAAHSSLRPRPAFGARGIPLARRAQLVVLREVRYLRC